MAFQIDPKGLPLSDHLRLGARFGLFVSLLLVWSWSSFFEVVVSLLLVHLRMLLHRSLLLLLYKFLVLRLFKLHSPVLALALFSSSLLWPHAPRHARWALVVKSRPTGGRSAICEAKGAHRGGRCEHGSRERDEKGDMVKRDMQKKRKDYI